MLLVVAFLLFVALALFLMLVDAIRIRREIEWLESADGRALDPIRRVMMITKMEGMSKAQERKLSEEVRKEYEDGKRKQS